MKLYTIATTIPVACGYDETYETEAITDEDIPIFEGWPQLFKTESDAKAFLDSKLKEGHDVSMYSIVPLEMAEDANLKPQNQIKDLEWKLKEVEKLAGIWELAVKFRIKLGSDQHPKANAETNILQECINQLKDALKGEQ